MISKMTETLDGGEDQRRFFRPQSVMPISWTARAHCSFLHLQPNLASMFHPILHVAPACPRAGLPTSVQIRKAPESPPRPALHRVTKAVSSASDFGHNAVGQPFWMAVPRTCTSSSFPHQPFISRHIHGPALSDSSRNRCRRRRQLVPLCILARANEGP